MKRSGFTMVELIFVIVILGILGAIAIPKLAATRVDAKASAIKNDLQSFMQAVPAYYTSRGQVRIVDAVANIDGATWVKTPGYQKYEFNESGANCITIQLADADENGTLPLLSTTNVAADDNTSANTLVIDVAEPSASQEVCSLLVNTFKVADRNITFAGSGVNW